MDVGEKQVPFTVIRAPHSDAIPQACTVDKVANDRVDCTRTIRILQVQFYFIREPYRGICNS